MSSSPQPRQGPVAAWVAQMVGTLFVAAAVFAFVKYMGAPLATAKYDFQRYMLGAILVAALPAILYLRHYRRLVVADEVAVERTGKANLRPRAAAEGACPGRRAVRAADGARGRAPDVRRRDAMVPVPTLITIAVRLPYRPFTWKPRR